MPGRKAHIIVDGQEMKHCSRCNRTNVLDGFSHNKRSWDGFHHHCKPCTREIVRNCNLKRLYGITVEEYEATFAAQDGKCAVCRQTCNTGQALSSDHDHETGKFRALLCRRCNSAFGLLDEDRERILALAAYAAAHQAETRS